jgi:hypothetical protein
MGELPEHTTIQMFAPGNAVTFTRLSNDHPASDSRVRAVATVFGGMAGRVEADEPRMMRPWPGSELHLVSRPTLGRDFRQP